MGIEDFSSAAQWAPLARRKLRQEERRRQGDDDGKKAKRMKGGAAWPRSAAVSDITALALPLQLNM